MHSIGLSTDGERNIISGGKKDVGVAFWKTQKGTRLPSEIVHETFLSGEI